MSKHPDPIAAGLERGWRVIDSASADLPQQIDCDVAIIGTGAGGGISAEILATQGLKVVLIEEGPLRSSRDFTNFFIRAGWSHSHQTSKSSGFLLQRHT